MAREVLPYTVVCNYCNKEFVAHTPNRKYCCEECTTKARYARDKYRYKQKAIKKAEGIKDKVKNIKSLSAVAAEAARHGMSYGKYVSYMQQQEQKG
jgi:hypothetical protein